MSGHLFFADRYYGYDDAIYASVRLLEILAESGKPLSATARRRAEDVLDAGDPRRRAPRACKFRIVEELKQRFAQEHDVLDIDGARINFDGGWGLVRASNTQPVLVLRFEAVDEPTLHAIRAEVEERARLSSPATADR